MLRLAVSVISFCCFATLLQAQSVRPVPLPIPGQVRDAGTLDWATGTWQRSGGTFAAGSGSNAVYVNTCNWSGGALYAPNASCWDQYEEGRLPTSDSSDPFLLTPGLDPSQLCDCYFLSAFEFGYCTGEVTAAQGGLGNLSIQIGFLEGVATSGIGGACMSAPGAAVPPSGGGLGLPPANLGSPRDLYIDLSTAGLPGSSAATPNGACWVVTVDLSNNANGGFAFCGNGGDELFSNDDTDAFNILYGLRGTTELSSPGTGFFVAGGDPAQGGAGSVGIPAAIDPITGTGCGIGLDWFDGSWINVDANPIGVPNTLACPASNAGGPLALGTGCYTFGGFPAAPPADVSLTLWAAQLCADGFVCDGFCGDPPISYCTPKPSSSGCLASLTGSQSVVVSGANDFSVILLGAQAGRPGIFFGSNTAQAAIPFQGGFLCVQPPTKRSVVMFTFGTPQQCDGSFSLLVNDGNLFPPPLPGGFDAGPGNLSFMQAWYRDPALMDGTETALSSALQITWM